MRILVVTSSKAAANSFRPETEIFCGLAKAGHQVTVMTRTSPEQVSTYVEAGVTVIDGEPKKKVCIESIKKIRTELSKYNYDIVYATNSKAIPNAGFACIGFKAKLVVYRGTTGGLYRHDPSAYLTILHPRVNGVVCVSNAVKDDVSLRVWGNNRNVETIYKGHNIEWYQDIQAANLSEFGIKTGDFTAICAVNARPSKGITVMLEAAKELARMNNFHLLLVGKNMDESPYKELIADSGMQERIHLTGYRYDVPELVKACNVLVQPSISGEGLPRAVMESMGIGTPVVITTTGGGKEIIEDGKSGFIVPIKSPKAIALKVQELANKPELAKKMVDINQQKIKGDLSSTATVDNYIRYFQSLIAEDK